SVVLFDAHGLIGTAETDERGLCSFPARGGAGEFLAGARGLAPRRAPTELGPGHTTFRFDGGRIAGTARATTGQPAAGLELVLDSRLAHYSVENLPADAASALPDWVARPFEITTATDLDGGFAFEGLDAAWTGSVLVGWTHWLAEATPG